jgi:uncharacterized membrane protein YhaH (DUF805 family)
MNWGHYLFGFSGRINRAKYWLWILLYLIAAIIVAAVIYFINSPIAGGIVQFAFSIAAFVSSLAVVTKRLHDRGKSAWWLLVYVLIPSILLGVGAGLAMYSGLSQMASSPGGVDLGQMGMISGILVLASFVFLIWAFVDLACLRGTIGANQYGPDPLEGRV